MNYGVQLKKIRRFLRDPDGNIWENAFLKSAFNDIQRELQHNTGFLEEAEAIRYPPEYQYSYMHDFEFAHLPSDQSFFHQCLRMSNDYVLCNRWEVQAYTLQTGDNVEDGSHFTHPWEGLHTTPGEAIPVKFPQNFYKSVLLAYDYHPLEYIERNDVITRDRARFTHEGTPTHYYREDTLSDTFVPYPKPSSYTFNLQEDVTNPNYVYTFDWEDGYIGGDSEQWLRTNTSYSYIFRWENDPSFSDYFRCMYPHEASFEYAGQYGMVLYTSDEDPMGTMAFGDYFDNDLGIAVDVIDGTNNFIIIHNSMSQDIQDESDESDFPEFLQKYIECGTIERAYGANTDGRIASLRSYWNFRYLMGQEVIKRFMAKRSSKRRLTHVMRQRTQHPRLPSTYPNDYF